MGGVALKERRSETDVLCIGGGIPGLMAAVRASECGSSVLVAEKANTLYSGSGGLGNDHFMCYLPEIHGPDIQPIIDEFQRGQQGGLRDRSFIKTWLVCSPVLLRVQSGLEFHFR